MRLNLREIIHVPGASLPFAFQLDLSQEEFFGEHPIPRPVQVQGRVKNVADVLVLEGEARSLLDYTCDRCMEPFQREKVVGLRKTRTSFSWKTARSMWAIWLTQPSCSPWIQNTCAQKTARGFAPAAAST